MKNKARKLLMNLGVDPALLGYDYLVEAVSLCFQDKKYLRNITKELYPYLAKENGTTASRAERAIRHAVEKTSEMCPDVHQKLIIHPSICRGKYTNSQFISACVEQLKMEDKNA